MSSLFPTAQDDATTLPNPSGTNKTNSPDHASLHGNANDAIKAIEAKVGTGASTPTANTLLRGNGTGTSAWGQLTSAQLAASLSDETGTGLAVFGTTPTLVTPQVDTINESTPTNGVTVDGLNIKDGKLNTADAVDSLAYTDGSIDPEHLATNAITLGYAQRTTTFTTAASATWQAVTSLSLSVTIPSGGRRIKITCFGRDIFKSGGGVLDLAIWDGTVGSGTQIATSEPNLPSGSAAVAYVCAVVSPSAGSKTYNIGINPGSASAVSLEASSTAPSFILVEVI
jgi:hypothetical protein